MTQDKIPTSKRPKDIKKGDIFQARDGRWMRALADAQVTRYSNYDVPCVSVTQEKASFDYSQDVLVKA